MVAICYTYIDLCSIIMFYYLRQGDTVFAGACLSVCLFVCEQLYTKSYERIPMKFSGSVGGGPRRNRLDFGSYQ